MYGNNGSGIICSLDCYNILIENNRIHDNVGPGIMFSRNMYNSIVRNNLVYDEDKGIFVSASQKIRSLIIQYQRVVMEFT